MNEPELFAAYRNDYGYASACACGSVIRSETGDERAVSEAIDIHNVSTVHEQWRAWRDALGAVEPANHPCPCHDHGASF